MERTVIVDFIGRSLAWYGRRPDWRVLRRNQLPGAVLLLGHEARAQRSCAGLPANRHGVGHLREHDGGIAQHPRRDLVDGDCGQRLVVMLDVERQHLRAWVDLAQWRNLDIVFKRRQAGERARNA
jgi:hypothetical protein